MLFDNSPYSSKKKTAIIAIPAAKGTIRPRRVLSQLEAANPDDRSNQWHRKERCSEYFPRPIDID